MTGGRTGSQEALFYELSLDRHVPASHLVRAIDRFVDLSSVRAQLKPFYSEIGRPSIDPELMIRMLLTGYYFGIRSERRLGYRPTLAISARRSRLRVRDGATDSSPSETPCPRP